MRTADERPLLSYVFACLTVHSYTSAPCAQGCLLLCMWLPHDPCRVTKCPCVQLSVCRLAWLHQPLAHAHLICSKIVCPGDTQLRLEGVNLHSTHSSSTQACNHWPFVVEPNALAAVKCRPGKEASKQTQLIGRAWLLGFCCRAWLVVFCKAGLLLVTNPARSLTAASAEHSVAHQVDEVD